MASTTADFKIDLTVIKLLFYKCVVQWTIDISTSMTCLKYLAKMMEYFYCLLKQFHHHSRQSITWWQTWDALFQSLQ